MIIEPFFSYLQLMAALNFAPALIKNFKETPIFLLTATLSALSNVVLKYSILKKMQQRQDLVEQCQSLGIHSVDPHTMDIVAKYAMVKEEFDEMLRQKNVLFGNFLNRNASRFRLSLFLSGVYCAVLLLLPGYCTVFPLLEDNVVSSAVILFLSIVTFFFQLIIKGINRHVFLLFCVFTYLLFMLLFLFFLSKMPDITVFRQLDMVGMFIIIIISAHYSVIVYPSIVLYKMFKSIWLFYFQIDDSSEYRTLKKLLENGNRSEG